MTPIETCEYIQGRAQILTWNNITYIDDGPLELRPTWPIKYTVLECHRGDGSCALQRPQYFRDAREKYIGFAAGGFWKYLGSTKYEFDVEPTRLNVTVNGRDKNITVVPTNDTKVSDIDPSRCLKVILLRQSIRPPTVGRLFAYTSAQFMVGEFHDKVNGSIL
ncbi:hypothetical protein DER46DRAFT_581477 [Fusarium sp. MPI-SDFR-AT-0072]|nr:hypothetical protein DER46DRAFT_581477 [Fusarium sp. MPI-SDFR-AT-0072]